MKYVKTFENFNSKEALNEMTEEEELNYLRNTKPKYTFKQLMGGSQALTNAFRENGAEDLISKWEGSRTSILQLKKQFKEKISNGDQFDKMFSKKWSNVDAVRSLLFHTLFYYHQG